MIPLRFLNNGKNLIVNPRANALLIKTSELGNGTGVRPCTVTLPFEDATVIGEDAELRSRILARLTGLIPSCRAVNWKVSNVPEPVMPGMVPISVSAFRSMVPLTLSMVPGMKETTGSWRLLENAVG